MATSPYLVSVDVTQPTLRYPTGKLYVVANQGDSIGPLNFDIPGVTPGIVSANSPAAGAGNYAYLQEGIPPSAPGTSYEVVVYDASPAKLPGFRQSFTIDPAPVQVPGCTDPAATNHDPAATAENGSCAYTPPVAKPFFSVPLLQALRFVVRGGSGQGFDHTLFCEQPRPGQQQRPYYYQLVQYDDQLRVQVLTSYDQVTATLYHHGGAAAGPAIALSRVRTLSGPTTPLAVELREHAPSGTTQLRAVGGGALPPSLLAAARLTLAGAASGTYRLTAAVPGSVLLLDDYLVLNRPWAATQGAVTATWVLTGPGYNVYEADIPLDGQAAGYYQLQLRATSSAQAWPAVTADSEPLHLKAVHQDTVTLDYRNADNCFGMVFATGITPRLRLWGTFFRQKNGGTLTDYEDSAANRTTLSSTATRLTTLETYGLPAYQHEKVYLALRLDYVVVNGERCATPAAYETSEVREYALSGGRADLQKTAWLGVGNGDDAGVDEAPDNALGLTEGGYLLLTGG